MNALMRGAITLGIGLGLKYGSAVKTNSIPGQPQITLFDFTGLSGSDFITGGAGKSFIYPQKSSVLGVWISTGTESQPDLSSEGVTGYSQASVGAISTDDQIASSVANQFSPLLNTVSLINGSEGKPTIVQVIYKQDVSLDSAFDVDSGAVITITQIGNSPS